MPRKLPHHLSQFDLSCALELVEEATAKGTPEEGMVAAFDYLLKQSGYHEYLEDFGYLQTTDPEASDHGNTPPVLPAAGKPH